MAERTFSDPDGAAWRVWHVDPAQQPDWPVHARRHLPPHLADGWLCFESAAEKRRLQPVPRGWEVASEEALWAHCSGALPVRRRTGAPAG